MSEEIYKLERELVGLKAQLIQAERDVSDLRSLLAAKKRHLDRLINQQNNPHIINTGDQP